MLVIAGDLEDVLAAEIERGVVNGWRGVQLASLEIHGEGMLADKTAMDLCATLFAANGSWRNTECG